MHSHLEILYQGSSLPTNDTQSLFQRIVSGEMDPHLAVALLVALKIKGESPDEITGAAIAMRDACKPFPRPPGQIADIVGTGGDNAQTINISSTSVFVAAAAGVMVCKHGNRSVSSKSGSADVLKELGINIEMSPDQALNALEKCKACFIFAPQYHTGFRHAVGIRKALRTRTIFNILGPLINPARPDVMLLGVYAEKLIQPIASVLPNLGVTRAMVVYGSGVDEICLHGPTDVIEVDHGQLNRYRISAEDLGLKTAALAKLQGGDPRHNALVSREILAGRGQEAHTHAIAANAGCLIYLAGKAHTPQQGVGLALDIIHSGAALSVLDALVQAGHD